MQPVVGDLDVELGYAYLAGAICAPSPPIHQNPRESKGRPGTRAPHAWIERAGTRISTIDLFGSRFTLLAGRDAQGWCDSAGDAASQLKLPLDVYRIGRDLQDSSDSIGETFGIGATGAVIVRPDGFVGWRSPVRPAETRDTPMWQTLNALTSRTTATVG